MAGILVADELADSRQEKDSADTASDGVEEHLAEERQVQIDLIDAVTKRVDEIAASLELS